MLSETRRIERGKLIYKVFCPPNADEKMPVLVFLHGSGEAAPLPIDEALSRHGPLKNYFEAKQPSDSRFIVVFPQLPANCKGDVWFKFAEEVREIAKAVQKDFNGDPNRTSLTGFSYGGNGVFDIAEKQPDFWSAFWAVDPTRTGSKPKKSEPQRLWKRPNKPVCLDDGPYSNETRGTGLHKHLNLKATDRHANRDRRTLSQKEAHPEAATDSYQDKNRYEWLP